MPLRDFLRCGPFRRGNPAAMIAALDESVNPSAVASRGSRGAAGLIDHARATVWTALFVCGPSHRHVVFTLGWHRTI